MNPSSVNNPVVPTLLEATDALFTPEEKQNLRKNLVTQQIEQSKYLRAHPEVDLVIRLALAQVLRDKPENAETYLTKFFGENDLEEVVAAAREAEAEKQRLCLAIQRQD